VNRVVDRNFVPNERYASLLVEEIPPRQRLQVALAVYRRKTEPEGKALRFFFDATIASLTPSDTDDLFAAVSQELRDDSDESNLRALLKLLNPQYWTRLHEAARLRTENRILQNARDGRYVVKTDKCLVGGLATWARDFLSHFSLRAELLHTFVEKLRSPIVESQDYVLRYFFFALDSLADSPPRLLENWLAERLKAGDQRVKDRMAFPWALTWTWSEQVAKALESFQAAEQVPDDDEVPF
jgi:hypothetical protein